VQDGRSLDLGLSFRRCDAWVGCRQRLTGEPTVFHSVDGGLSWQPQATFNTPGGLYGVRFADRLHGIALGMAGVVFMTANGGETWESRRKRPANPS
jgi:photosystem II stability/assembly factor-like uncharacterized protein